MPVRPPDHAPALASLANGLGPDPCRVAQARYLVEDEQVEQRVIVAVVVQGLNQPGNYIHSYNRDLALAGVRQRGCAPGRRPAQYSFMRKAARMRSTGLSHPAATTPGHALGGHNQSVADDRHHVAGPRSRSAAAAVLPPPGPEDTQRLHRARRGASLMRC